MSKNKNRRIAALLCAALAALLPAGCAGENPQAVPVANVAEQPPTALPPPEAAPPDSDGVSAPSGQGGLTLSMRVPKTLNPLLNEDATVDRVLRLVFEPLFMLDEKQRPVPNLAEDIHVSEDGLSAEITLRGDAVWSDGRAITAADVAFSLQTIANAGDQTIYKHMAENVASATDAGSRTVRISFHKASGALRYDLCFPVIPRHYYQGETVPDSAVNMSPLGSGMYAADKYTPAKSLSLSVNPNSLREKAFIEKIEVLITPDRETDLHAFNESIIDVVDTDMTEWGRYRGTKEANIAEYAGDTFDFIGFNFQRGLWRDKQARVAVAHAINPEELVESIYLNHAVRAYTPVNPESWVFEPSVQTYAFDLDKAAELYQEQPFSILVNEENAERVKIADSLQENLSKIGMKCFVYQRPFDEYERMLLNREFDLAVCGLSMGVEPDISFAFHSEATPEAGGRNVFSYQDDTMDALLTQAAAATSDIAFTSYLSEVQKLFADELPCVSLAFRKRALLTHERVQGQLRPTIGDSLANINEWVVNAGDEEV